MDNRRQSGLWDQNAQGVYERKAPPGPYQYYQPPSSTDNRRSFAERAVGGGTAAAPNEPFDDLHPNPPFSTIQDGVQRTASKRRPEVQAPKPVPSGQQQKLENIHRGLSQHPVDLDDIPSNLRSTTWSPDPLSPGVSNNAPPSRHPSNATEPLRRGSVPDRSPLQNLEARFDTISKEEKRARVAEVERKARQKSSAGREENEGNLGRSGTLRGEKARVVSDSSRKANEGAKRDDTRRNSAIGNSESENGHAKFRRASDALRTEIGISSPPMTGSHPVSTSKATTAPSRQAELRHSSAPQANNEGNASASGVDRSNSQKYRHRARDAGFIGAAAAVAGRDGANANTGDPSNENAAARGKAAYERRKSQAIESPLASPTSPTNTRDRDAAFNRSDSKRLQKQPPTTQRQSEGDSTAARSTSTRSAGKHLLQQDRVGADTAKSAGTQLEPDPLPKEMVKAPAGSAVPYTIPPQTAAAQQAKVKVGFSQPTPDRSRDSHDEKAHHHLRDMFHRHKGEHRGYQASARPLDEWRHAKAAKLTAADLILDSAPSKNTGDQSDSTWWESDDRRQSGATKYAPVMPDGPYEEEAQAFRPQLFLKCGPLLRFTGLSKGSGKGDNNEKRHWRGSVMIVTEDSSSDLSTPPVLRLFAQAMDLHQPTRRQQWEGAQGLAAMDGDPVAGQVKTSRTGRPIFVRPVSEIEPGVDLSRQENNQGLFSASRTPVLGSQSTTGPDGKRSQHIAFQTKSRIRRRDGEKLGKHREVKGHRLHVEQGCTFWRFNLEIELGPKQSRIAYRINRGPAIGFWVPARGETMNVMFHSCNGFSLTVNANDFCGPDPLWRDVLNRHQRKPFHVMVGGGDQIYNDAAIRDTHYFKEWLQVKNPEHKHNADFTTDMQEELETFYFDRYAMWFSQGLFSMANSQIPMVNMYDDHDIIDGFGSYPHRFMSSPVFAGLGAVAFKYYMLFQHQSLVAESSKEEPSWLLGASPGPYINELSRSIFVWLSEKVALLALDCRTERMRDEVLSVKSYDIIFDRLRAEIIEGKSKHLIVLLGVPIAYPRLNFLENMLTSRVMDPIKALGRTGALGGFVNKFDGGVEILDDLDDHWTAKHHKAERNWFIQELQELAAERSVRVTILGGDVHLGAVGQFYSNKKLGIAKDKDHRYMPNVISSAIVNTPPPVMMADVLNRRNKIHHLDEETDEDMIPMFEHDIDGSKRNNKRLLPRRNFATICEYLPGTTPPPSPRPMERASTDATAGAGRASLDTERDRRYPPGSGLNRTMSLGRGAGSLVRRLSLSRSRKSVDASQESAHDNGSTSSMQRSNSLNAGSETERPTYTFHRRPTNLSVKEARRAAAKGGPEEEEMDGKPTGHIDLEGGLDINLCMETDQHDPLGHTTAYRILVPALWYEGQGDINTLPAHRPSLFRRLTGRGQGGANRGGDEDYYEHDDEHDSQYTDSREGSPDLPSGGQQAGRAPHAALEPADRRRELQDLQATAAGAGSGARYGVEGAFGQPRGAFRKGYELDGQPIGERAAQGGNKKTLATWQTSGPAHTRQTHNGRYDGEAYDDDESLTPSGSEAEEAGIGGRRLSKAERFFGIGEEEEEEGQGRRVSEGGAKKKWQVWKR